jgi:ABC-type glycerol-3-phosphate transport system substrate-binding protein
MPWYTTIRRMALILVTLGLLIAHTACVQVGPTAEPVTITFACSEEQEEHYSALLEAFAEKHGHITVEFVRPPRSRWPDADVLDVGPFTRRYMDQQDFAVLDLRPYLEHDDTFSREDFDPKLFDMFTDEDGEVWAIPYWIEVSVMYYNKDLFDEYATAYPQLDWTWDDFMRAGQALHDPDRGVFGYVPDPEHDDALTLVYQNGGRIFDDWANPTRTTFDDPLTIEALDWYAKLMHEHKAMATPLEARQTYGITGYIKTGTEQGRIGMWPAGISDRGGRLSDERWGFEWGIVPLPRGKEQAAFAFTDGLAISSETENADACWKWIAFLTRQVPLYGMPVRKSLVESKTFEDEVGRDVAAVARVSVEHALFLSPAAWDIYGTFQIFAEAVDKIDIGTVSAQEAMEWAQAKSQYK